MSDYYSSTTDRDYMLLEKVVGPGLHSRLDAGHPVYTGSGHSRQVTFVYGEARAVSAKRVLEVGFGRGFNTLLLAGLMPGAQFVGVDLTPRHVEVAREAAAKGGYSNVHFLGGDASGDLEFLADGFDLVFGIEALCHLDSDTRVLAFLRSMGKQIRPGGRLVIVDGFRSKTFSTTSMDQRRAMRLAERGFRIAAMPSKRLWIEEGAANGFSLVFERDLTREALPFWELGWRAARVLMWFPVLVR